MAAGWAGWLPELFGTTKTIDIQKVKEIRFQLQGVEQVVYADQILPSTSLNSYIRNNLGLTGTKYLCFEGGCGSCLVVIKGTDPVTKATKWKAVNSCLVSVLSCNGWSIYTIEGIGGPLANDHPAQQAIQKFNGTQCGFCTPGMVMNMFALYESGKLTMVEVENSFGGNICRCTGYRSILSAFKSLCTDASSELLGKYPDIEDLRPCKRECRKEKCENKCLTQEASLTPFITEFGASRWIKVIDLKSLQSVLAQYGASSYMLVCGNIAKAIYGEYYSSYDTYVDVSAVPELKVNQVENKTLILGANNTLSSAAEILIALSQQDSANFTYLKKIADHIDLVANVPVRNVGSIAGNLMMKRGHHEFPSDVFVVLEAAGATLTITDVNGVQTKMSPLEFLTYDMNMKIIQHVTFPALGSNNKFETYKIMKRAQNTYAHVNAGFLFELDALNIVTSCRIVYGNIETNFHHAIQAETYLVGKALYDNTTLQGVYEALSKELVPSTIPPDPSPQFRKDLAIALFYKAVLTGAPDAILTDRNKSGGVKLERPLSTGVQDYQTNESLYPLTQPISKIEAKAQTTGEAEYINDFPDRPNQLYGSFVLSEAPPKSTVVSVDASDALKIAGVVAFIGPNDIPGQNNFAPSQLFGTEPEEIFCSDKVRYYNQPIGLIVADNFGAAEDGASAVKATYGLPEEKPVLSSREVIAAGKTQNIHERRKVTRTRRGEDVQHVVTGKFDIYHQYHFHMEGQCCNVVPHENGLDIYPSSQWMDLIQIAVANALNISNNKVDVTVRRCGGGFGAKITRNSFISCAAAVAAWKLRRPVKLAVPLIANMSIIGKRFPLSIDYEVGVDAKGVIQYLDSTFYSDVGCQNNEDSVYDIVALFMGTYTSDTFSITANTVNTDTCQNTYARAPGSTEGLSSMEAVMEHIAYAINSDPLEVRAANLKDATVTKYMDDLKQWADIENRRAEIASFNQANRWKKKGMAIVPMVYEFNIGGPFFSTVTIYHGDGSIAISHGGIEIGQGINTKAAQVCAYKLGIPIEKITVIPSKNFISPNSSNTGGSVTSEAICYGVIKACDILNERLTPYRDDPTSTWKDVVERAHRAYVPLSAQGSYAPNDPDISGYLIYGITAAEVIVDILTGQHIVSRVDLIEDVGQSLSPEVDIGQVEGAFVMGMGYHTLEQLIFDEDGKVLTNSTWTYSPPGPKDIPVDFRVKFPKDNPNPIGVLQSKAMAEPPLCMSVAVPLAIRNAVASARTDSDSANGRWYPFDGPSTVENTFLNSLNVYSKYVL